MQRSAIMRLARLCIAFASLVAAIAVVRDTWHNGWDFHVFYRAARELLEGRSPYRMGQGTQWMFKYPPWVLPALLPLGGLSESGARLAWGLSQLSCLIYVVHWLRAQRVRAGPLVFTFVAFWVVIAYHALAGQFTLLVLALALRAERASAASPARTTTAAWALSAKVFHLVSLLGLKRPLRHWLIALLSCVVLSLPVLWVTPGHSPHVLLEDWKNAAGSSATQMDAIVVRGWRNQGFPAGALRILDVPATRSEADFLAFAVCAVLMSLFWHQSSRRLSPALRWSGWLALGVATHPLAWKHSFVPVIPLSALALNQVWRASARWRLALAVFGSLATSLVSRNGLGDWVIPLEFISIRSWGILALLLSVAWTDSPREPNL